MHRSTIIPSYFAGLESVQHPPPFESRSTALYYGKIYIHPTKQTTDYSKPAPMQNGISPNTFGHRLLIKLRKGMGKSLIRKEKHGTVLGALWIFGGSNIMLNDVLITIFLRAGAIAPLLITDRLTNT